MNSCTIIIIVFLIIYIYLIKDNDVRVHYGTPISLVILFSTIIINPNSMGFFIFVIGGLSCIIYIEDRVILKRKIEQHNTRFKKYLCDDGNPKNDEVVGMNIPTSEQYKIDLINIQKYAGVADIKTSILKEFESRIIMFLGVILAVVNIMVTNKGHDYIILFHEYLF